MRGVFESNARQFSVTNEIEGVFIHEHAPNRYESRLIPREVSRGEDSEVNHTIRVRSGEVSVVHNRS